MSTAFNEAVKRVLADVNKFLEVSLRPEGLSKVVEKERTRLLEQLKELFLKYDSLAPSTSDDGSCSSSKDNPEESRNTTGSSHGSEEDGYADNIPDTTVKALTDEAVKIGYLEKKGKDGLSLFGSGWKKIYCVIHKNVFYFFKKPNDKKQQGAFSIVGYTVQEAPQNVKDAAKKDCSFELVAPGKKPYQFCADNVSDFQEWKEAINKSQEEKESAQEDDGDVYEPLDEVGVSSPVIPIKETKVEPALQPIEPKSEDVDEWNDDMTYEPLDDVAPQVQSPTGLPPRMPLPPIPTPTPTSPADFSPPPIPSRETQARIPPALPKRNVLPPTPTEEVPEKKMRIPALGEIRLPSEDFENMFYGMYPCKGGSANELSFNPGEIVHIISRDLDLEDWWIGELKGSIGLVPKSFLHPAYQPLD